MLPLLLSFTAEGAGGQPMVQMVEGSEKSKRIQISQAKGNFEAELGTLKFVASFPSGTDLQQSAFTIFLPDTGQFWWSWGFRVFFPFTSDDELSRFLESHSVYVLKNKVTVFRVGVDNLEVRESGIVYRSKEVASQSLPTLLRESVARGELLSLFQQIDLSKKLPDQFLHRGAAIGMDIRITAVDRRNGKWEVGLKNSESLRASVMLDDAYEVLEVHGPVKAEADAQ